MTAKNKAWKKRRRAFRTALAIILLGGKCSRCGATENLVTHHVDPSSKEFGVLGSGVVYRLERFLAELAKCELLCKPCHGKTHEERGEGFLHEKRAVHGSTTGYRLGCRCEYCRRAHTEYNQERKRQYRPGERRHGTTAEFNRGCRCRMCQAASKAYHRSRRRNAVKKGVIKRVRPPIETNAEGVEPDVS